MWVQIFIFLPGVQYVEYGIFSYWLLVEIQVLFLADKSQMQFYLELFCITSSSVRESLPS